MKLNQILNESVPTLSGDIVDFFHYVVKNVPDYEEFSPEQETMLQNIVDALYLYRNDYGENGITKAEREGGFHIENFASRYNAFPNESIRDVDDLDAQAEEFYEYLVEKYS